MGDEVLFAEVKDELRRWEIECFVLREVRNRAVGDTVFCAERGKKLRFGRCSVLDGDMGKIERLALDCYVLRDLRNRTVGDRVLCAEEVRNWAVGGMH